MLRISLRLVGLNIYFYDVFFLFEKGFKKGYIEIMGFFYCEMHIKVRQTYRFYTTFNSLLNSPNLVFQQF